MESKAGIRSLVTITFLACLVAYHFANALAPQNKGTDILMLYKICQWVALVVVTFLFVSSEFVAALILAVTGKRFIGGMYSGYSYKDTQRYPLKLTVRQSMFEARVEAQSKRADGQVVSNWVGTRFKEDAQTSFFGIELRPISDLSETGILDLAYRDNSLSGSYRPALPRASETYRIELTRDEPNSWPWRIVRRTPLYNFLLNRQR